ncbi:MAG: ABC transporter permease [Candidatus Theseobacter exili]|nr:ABC transporter permease [Candidatus Theseobacter exili]
MKSYLLKRIAGAIGILFGVVCITFIMMYIIPGDPVQSFIGQRADPETVQSLRAEMGLNKPLAVQFVRYLGRSIRGDLGRSFFTGKPVTRSLVERFPTTAALALGAIVIAAFLGIGTGIIAAVRKGSWVDKTVMTLTVLGISTPVFWTGLLFLIGFFYLVKHNLWFPYFNSYQVHLLLGMLTLGIRPTAFIARLTRVNLVEALDSSYITAAESRGLSRSRIVLKHALRNALIPIVTLLGLDLGSLLGGAAITETIFALPGIGKFALEGIGRRDYPVIIGMVLFTAFLFVAVNLIIDLLYPVIDPKIRLERKRQI